MGLIGRSKAFAPLRGASYFSLLVQREVTKRSAFPTAERLVKHGPDASRCGCAASVPCAPRVSRGRRTTRFAQTRAPLRPSTRCGARLALRPLEVRSQEQKHNHDNGPKVMLIDCSRKRRSSGSCFCLSESPSAATEPAGKTRRATCMGSAEIGEALLRPAGRAGDARHLPRTRPRSGRACRFSTRQGRTGKRRDTASPRCAGRRRGAAAPAPAASRLGRVEKSRRRSGPDALAHRARRQGRVDQPFGCWESASLGYFSLHEQREVTRSPQGSESFAPGNEGSNKCASA